MAKSWETCMGRNCTRSERSHVACAELGDQLWQEHRRHDTIHCHSKRSATRLGHCSAQHCLNLHQPILGLRFKHSRVVFSLPSHRQEQRAMHSKWKIFNNAHFNIETGFFALFIWLMKHGNTLSPVFMWCRIPLSEVMEKFSYKNVCISLWAHLILSQGLIQIRTVHVQMS